MKYRDLVPEFSEGHRIARKAWRGMQEIYLHLKSQVVYAIYYESDHGQKKVIRKAPYIPGKEVEENDWILLGLHQDLPLA